MVFFHGDFHPISSVKKHQQNKSKLTLSPEKTRCVLIVISAPRPSSQGGPLQI